MRKALAVVALALCMTLSSCAVNTTPASTTPYTPVTQVDHYTLEPDETAALPTEEIALYQGMIDAMLAGEESAPAADNEEHNDLLLDLLRESPYFFFVSEAVMRDGRVYFAYAYTQEERDEMLALMDERLLEIVNHDADESDNELDSILKIYHAVTTMEYDHSRKEEIEDPDSPLFAYPGDEVYRMLNTGEGVCYSFAYVFRLAMQQRGFECFTVRGTSGADHTPHMWNMFRYDDALFYCDPTWDRARDAYSRLDEFGKTEDERQAERVATKTFGTYHFAEYGKVDVVDKRFGIFRGITRFAPAGEHAFLIENFKGEQKIFHTDTFEVT